MFHFIEAAGRDHRGAARSGEVSPNYRRYRLSPWWLEFRRESGETQPGRMLDIAGYREEPDPAFGHHIDRSGLGKTWVIARSMRQIRIRHTQAPQFREILILWSLI